MGGGCFYLFLYRIGIDGNLRNRPLDEGQAPPVWLVLHYLLTAFDGPESDSTVAHKLLSRGMLALNTMSVLRPDATITALSSSPDPLRISFDEADVEMLSKIMQGSDEKYRVSAAFQVRPVMIASTDAPPGYALPVKTIGLPLPPPQVYQGATVLPSLGAQVTAIVLAVVIAVDRLLRARVPGLCTIPMPRVPPRGLYPYPELLGLAACWAVDGFRNTSSTESRG